MSKEPLTDLFAARRWLDASRRSGAGADAQQALRLYRAVGDRGDEAATLTNIGVHDRLGQPEQALQHYHQALPITREVGDRAGEAITRYNVAMIHRGRREWDQAVAELERVV